VVADRTRLALMGDLDHDDVMAVLMNAGGQGPVHDDYEGGSTVALVGWESAEPGVARLRAAPNRQPDGTWALPELPDCRWIIETTVAASVLDDNLAALASAAPSEPLLLYRIDDR
jgi:hypothetical protein